MKIFLNILQWLCVIVLAISVFLLVFTVFNPAKNFQVLRVMSGSMEPTLKTGAIVATLQTDPTELKEGDIITFTSNSKAESVTHRLIKIDHRNSETKFITKGDANKTNDVDEILPSAVEGKVIFSIPYFGYLSTWIKQPLGFVLLIILPALLIIINEILNIKKTVKAEVKKKLSESKTISMLLLLLMVLTTSFSIKTTSAYFSDTLALSGNVFSTGNWVTPTPTPTGTTVIISGNAEDSENTVDITNTNNETTVEENDTTIITEILSVTNTGENQ